jgi:hypothetical protein
MKERNKELGFPEVIMAYWSAANAGDIQEASQCFSHDAVVQDESQTHEGTGTIRSWIEETTRKYHPLVEALRWEKREERYHVTARVSGTFPGRGSFYLGANFDSSDQPLRGENTYRLHVPANLPVSQFWAVTIYNTETSALFLNLTRPKRPRLRDLGRPPLIH